MVKAVTPGGTFIQQTTTQEAGQPKKTEVEVGVDMNKDGQITSDEMVKGGKYEIPDMLKSMGLDENSPEFKNIMEKLNMDQQGDLKGFANELYKSGSVDQQKWADFVGGVYSGPTIEFNDVMAMVQWVIRESYGQNIEDLSHYANKVKEFNKQKELVRDYTQELREFQTGMKEEGLAQGMSFDPPDETSLAWMQSYISDHSTNVTHAAVNTAACYQSADEMVAAAEDMLQNNYGDNVALPQELKDQMMAAMNSDPIDEAAVSAAIEEFAGYLSYLGDGGVQGGNWGQAGYDDITHTGGAGKNHGPNTSDGDAMWADYQHYKNDSANAGARSNLATGDVAIIEKTFGLPAGTLDGSSSIDEVVATATSPVYDAWANELKTGQYISTNDISDNLRTYGPNSEWAIKMFGSPEAAAEAWYGAGFTDGGPGSEAYEKAMLGIPNGVPPPGCTSMEQIDNAIEDWEGKLASIGDDAQLANVDMQNMLQKMQQTLQMMSNISKTCHDTAMAVIRKFN
jgi:hypothetical protein